MNAVQHPYVEDKFIKHVIGIHRQDKIDNQTVVTHVLAFNQLVVAWVIVQSCPHLMMVGNNHALSYLWNLYKYMFVSISGYHIYRHLN